MNMSKEDQEKMAKEIKKTLDKYGRRGCGFTNKMFAEVFRVIWRHGYNAGFINGEDAGASNPYC